VRRTKIIATLGPATSSEDKIEALIRVGVDVTRFNFSHGDHHMHLRTPRSCARRRRNWGVTWRSCKTSRVPR
jgi:pyruvate kinase